MITEKDFTRISNDIDGNPRYVIHYLQCCPERFKTLPVNESYRLTCKLMNKIGGKKYHTKSYGGGIVFKSYSLPEKIKDINAVMK